jgi:hypothetical protein
MGAKQVGRAMLLLAASPLGASGLAVGAPGPTASPSWGLAYQPVPRPYLALRRFGRKPLHHQHNLEWLEMVRRQVAIIVATPGTAVSAAKAATSDIPIVFATGIDPVSAGFVASLNRPGGNATGVYTFITVLAAKRLGLLRELVPAARRIAMLAGTPVGDAAYLGNMEAAKKDAEVAAAAMGLTIDMLGASTSRDIDAAFATMAEKRTEALLVNPSTGVHEPPRSDCLTGDARPASCDLSIARVCRSRRANDVWNEPT